MIFSDSRPIIACSSGVGTGSAIGIIRISGFASLDVFTSLFSLSLNKLSCRKIVRTCIIDNGQVLDDVMLCFFASPNSYTGENILEIYSHGNPWNINRIINFFKNHCEFRDALPGEFTLRAVKNGKMSLAQAEGLDLLLNSHNTLAFNQGLQLLNGELFFKYAELYERYTDLKIALDILIDFSEDVGEIESRQNLEKCFSKLRSILFELNSRTQNNSGSLLQPKIVIYGNTNAGKSSFFNFLVGHDRSIVTNVPGTTRDYICENISINGNIFSLHDTAGIRDSLDEIESIGISRSENLLKDSFFKILVINANEFSNNSSLFTHAPWDLILVTHLNDSNSNFDYSLMACASPYVLGLDKLSGGMSYDVKFFKSLNGAENSGPIEPLTNSGPIEPLANSGPIEPLTNSGPIEPLTNSGPIEPLKNSGPIEPLKNSGPIEPPKETRKNSMLQPSRPFFGAESAKSILERLVDKKYLELEQMSPVLLPRHCHLIQRAYADSCNLINNINTLDASVLSSEVAILGVTLSELIGFVSPDDVLQQIFSRFCIGK